MTEGPPPGYYLKPPDIEWQLIGEIGYSFGFSSEPMTYTEAKQACEYQVQFLKKNVRLKNVSFSRYCIYTNISDIHQGQESL